MKVVYTRASVIRIWLGYCPVVDNDAAALDLILLLISRPDRVGHAYTHLQLRETAPKALLALLESIYWQWTWAVQEELLSRNAVLHFGNAVSTLVIRGDVRCTIRLDHRSRQGPYSRFRASHDACTW